MNRLATALAAGILLAAPAAAQNFSGLKDKELPRIADIESGVSDVIGGLIGGGRELRGSITRVVVTDDRERSATVKISISGFAGASLVGAVLDAQRQAVGTVGQPKIRVDSSTKEIVFVFELKSDLPDATAFGTTYLRLALYKLGNPLPGRTLTYAMAKQWQTLIRPENVLVQVTPRPIGDAATLDVAGAVRFPKPGMMMAAAPPAAPPAPPSPGAAPATGTAVPMMTAARLSGYRALEPGLAGGTGATGGGSGADKVKFTLTSEFGNRQALDFHPRAPGKIVLEAAWSGSAQLALILNGPGQTGYYARQDGASPLRVEYDLTQSVLAQGDAWKASIVNFSKTGPVEGWLTVTYPVAGEVARTIIGPWIPRPVRIPAPLGLGKPGDFTTGLTKQQVDSGQQGPAAQPIDLLEGVITSGGVDFSTQELNQLLGLRTTVYTDKNPASGAYYFVPGAYHVRWDPDAAYDLHIIYRSAGDTGSGGAVQMSARLSAGIGTSDYNVAAWLLQAYVKRNPVLGQRQLQLQRLPIDSFPSISLSDDLKRSYDIPASKVMIDQLSAELDELSVGWVTDARTSTDMQTELVAKGLTGQAELKPHGALGPQGIPIEIKLRDPGTYGPLLWLRDAMWRNRTLYPITVKRLHALLVDTQGKPTIFSWDLGNAVVPPQAQLGVNAAGIVPWLDQSALRMWIEYGVAQDCDSCDRAAMKQIRTGSTQDVRVPIAFHTLTPLADMGAAVLTLKLRSRYFQPRLSSVTPATSGLTLTADSKDYAGGTVYPPPTPEDSAAAAAAGPLFEYLVSVVMPDGTVHEGATWIPVANPATVFVGRAQVKQSLGYLPGEPPHND